MQTIDDILNGVPEPEVAPDVEPVEAPAPVETPAVDPTGVKQEAVPPTPEKQDERMVPLKAVEDFRHKWQESERARKELEAQIAQREEKKAPDIFEDPEGYQKHLTERLEFSRVQDRIALSREMLLMVKDDYEQREQEFLELAKNDQALIQKMMQSSNPAKFVHDTAVKAEKAKALENVDEFESKVRAEIEAKVRAEIKAEAEAQAAKTAKKDAAITPNLTKARAVAPVDFEAEESLESLLRR